MLRLQIFLFLIIFPAWNDHRQISDPETASVQKLTAFPVNGSPVAQLGEGAFWDYNKKVLYWIDISGMKLIEYSPSGQTWITTTLDKMPGTIVPCKNGDIILALRDGLYRMDPENKKSKYLGKPASLAGNERFNDGKCDPSGRLWVGSMKLSGKSGDSYLYRYDKSGTFSEMLDSVKLSNGIVWSEEKELMYYIDTPTRQVSSFHYEPVSGGISGRKSCISIGELKGFPDGMTIDENGDLWIALWGGSSVVQFDPDNGKMKAVISLPVTNVTSCAFGGLNLDTLYITTAKGESENDGMAGKLFYSIPGVKGKKMNYFNE